MKKIIQNILFIFCLGAWISTSLSAQSDNALVVESINYQGNFKTDKKVIQRYLTIVEGQPVTKQQLKADQFRLQSTNLFRDVELLIIPGSDKGMAKITVNIKERRWPYFQFKSGFNELDGWYLSPLGLRFDNLFGKGHFFGFEILIGDRIGGSQLEFVKPFFFDTEYDIWFRIMGFNRNFLHILNEEKFEQNVKNSGVMAGISGNSRFTKYFSVAFEAQETESDSLLTSFPNDSLAITAPPILARFRERHKNRKVIFAAKIDTRDKTGGPTSGWWGGFTFESAAFEFEETETYTRAIFDIRRYNRLWKNVSGALRFKYGRVSENAPFYEKFYLGGPNSLRGYDDRSLTPLGYASRITQASAEIRFPLSRRFIDQNRLGGVLFYDAGFAWNEPQSFQSKRLKSSLGYGVRIRLPIFGLVRMDFAYPVPEYDFHFHLSLGHTF